MPHATDAALADTASTGPHAADHRATAELPGYDVRERLGVGGMGEVVLAFDRAIGREIAIKRIRGGGGSSYAVARFLREARVQARLEHPAIVPVYALGHDSAGDPFFTMKRLDGRTLAELLRAPAPPPLCELLRTLVDACRAVQLAHARGVVHRDLKPANVMVGAFGEVYVLDWGIARIVDDSEAVARAGELGTLDGKTETGALIGTPGYMAPEQIVAASEVGPPADVYAVGAILFELLTGAQLHPIGVPAIAATLAGACASPLTRAPDRVPPELDELCRAALASDPASRPTIEEVADGIQRYLDGDRDHERRRTLAAIELDRARAALTSPGEAGRANAIRAAGRALALDPSSPAAALIGSLMLQPPARHPPSLAVELAASDGRVQRQQNRVAAAALGAVVLFLVAVGLDGVRDRGLLAVSAGFAAITTIVAWMASRRELRQGEMWLVAIANTVLAMLLSRMFGSLIVTPLVTCIMAVSLTSYPQLMRHTRLVIAMLLAGWLLPVGLECTGVLAETWRVEDGAIVSMSSMLELGGRGTAALLVGANILAIVVIAMFANALARSRHAAQRDVEIQAWHLRHLLPDHTRAGAATPDL